MTAKEKALSIMSKIDYEVNGDINDRNKKDLAIMFCKEIINCDLESIILGDGSWTNPHKYWNEVKKEIEAL